MSCRPVYLALCAAALGCTSPSGTTSGRVSGPHDIALTDDLLFITSADTNELRVLRLTVPNSTFRAFARAPNPLEPLSIPTVDRPTQMVQDERWSGGRLGQGSYVFASRPGGTEVSVVGIDPSVFREVKRLVLPAPLSATAAVRLADDTSSRLYAAVLDGSRSVLFAADLPSAASALRSFDAQGALKVLATFDDESVVALTVVPGLVGRNVDGRAFCADVARACVAVATRRLGGGGGRTMLLDPESLQAVALAFPSPVRVLVTHGQTLVLDGSGNPQVGLAAGRRLVAVLDEEACGGPACGGVVAVDTLTGHGADGFGLVVDGAGRPVARLMFGGAPPVGVAIGANPSLADGTDGATLRAGLIEDGGVVLRAVPALGAVTVADGTVSLFDAVSMRPFDAAQVPPRAQNVRFETADGGALPSLAGPISGDDGAGGIATGIAVAQGVWSTDTVTVSWEGALSDEPLRVASTSTTLAVPASVAARLVPGDGVRFDGAAGPCGTSQVTAVGADTVSVATLPVGCQGATFSLFASAQAPFVLRRGALPTYLGRAASGSRFRWFPPGAAGQPALELSFGTETDITPPVAGARWRFDVIDGASPLTAVLDLTRTTCGAPGARQLPGRPVFDERRGRLFIAYPSVNGVADLNPASVFRGTVDVESGVSCYR